LIFKFNFKLWKRTLYEIDVNDKFFGKQCEENERSGSLLLSSPQLIISADFEGKMPWLIFWSLTEKIFWIFIFELKKFFYRIDKRKSLINNLIYKLFKNRIQKLFCPKKFFNFREKQKSNFEKIKSFFFSFKFSI